MSDIVGDFIRSNGERFRVAPLTPEENEILRHAIGRKRFKAQQCFYNAQRVLFDDASERLTYVEGYAGGSTLHAWLALGDKVIDVTPVSKPFASYFGVRFARRYVEEAWLRPVPGLHPRERVFTLLDNWRAGWPVQHDHERRWAHKPAKEAELVMARPRVWLGSMKSRRSRASSPFAVERGEGRR